MNLNQLLANAKPPRWARFGATKKLSRRQQMALGLRLWLPATHRDRIGACYPKYERDAINRALKARNDLDREYLAKFPETPAEKFARYNAKGQRALDAEVVRRRRAP
jgi:hypothetical protein